MPRSKIGTVQATISTLVDISGNHHFLCKFILLQRLEMNDLSVKLLNFFHSCYFDKSNNNNMLLGGYPKIYWWKCFTNRLTLPLFFFFFFERNPIHYTEFVFLLYYHWSGDIDLWEDHGRNSSEAIQAAHRQAILRHWEYPWNKWQ